MKHVRFFKESGDYWVVDQGSAQGTWLNGNRLKAQQKQKVTPGDEVCVGRKGSENLTYKVKMVHSSVWEQVEQAGKGDRKEMNAPAKEQAVSA